jgi:hypothetical protein
MSPLIFLLLGVLCGLISRGLLIKAAFSISKKWGFGVFFPFGPLFFRLSFPDEVGRARRFQLATLPCFFLYILTSPELIPSTHFGLVRLGPAGHEKYALVVGNRTWNLFGGDASAAARQKLGTLEERRAANDRELERLRLWSARLRLRKRDLLNSDKEGALAYNRDLADYEIAAEKADAERDMLGLLASNTLSR